MLRAVGGAIASGAMKGGVEGAGGGILSPGEHALELVSPAVTGAAVLPARLIEMLAFVSMRFALFRCCTRGMT